jgi:hypothetical protein
MVDAWHSWQGDLPLLFLRICCGSRIAILAKDAMVIEMPFVTMKATNISASLGIIGNVRLGQILVSFLDCRAI